jgi:hypothetical protein
MSWTSEYPTKPGFYWIRNYLRNVDEQWKPYEEVEAGPHIVEVDKDLDFYLTGSEVPRNRKDLVSAEWQGPIEPDTKAARIATQTPAIACRDCGGLSRDESGLTGRQFISWILDEVDGRPVFGIICRECWIKRLTPEQRKVYMV